MEEIYQILAANFGVASRRQLLVAGVCRSTIAQAVRLKLLRVIRRGWYYAPGVVSAPRLVVSAVRAGGALTGLAALALHQVWTMRPPTLEVRVTRLDRAKHNPEARFHTLRKIRYAPVHAAVDDPETAFCVVLQSETREQAIIAGDSMLRPHFHDALPVRGPLLTRPRLQRLTARYNRHIRQTAQYIDGLPESPLESLAKARLLARRISFQLQHRPAGENWRLDVLIGRSLVLEIDGRAFHSDPIRFEADRLRDQRLQVANYVVLRLTYQQIVNDWPIVFGHIQALMRRSVHRRRTFTLVA